MRVYEFECSKLQLDKKVYNSETCNDSTSSLSSALTASNIDSKPSVAHRRSLILRRTVQFDIEANYLHQTLSTDNASDLWYSEADFYRNREVMIENTRSLKLGNGLCQRILGRVYSESCSATSDNHLDRIPVLRSKLLQVYEQCSDSMVGLEKYLIGAIRLAHGEQRRASVLKLLKEATLDPISEEIIRRTTFPSHLFAREIANALEQSLAEELEEETDDEDDTNDENDTDDEEDMGEDSSDDEDD